MAATNATLVWLGGGTLASGGLGMAGGTLVLGGIVAAPALLISSFVISKFAEGKHNDAKAYVCAIDALVEAMEAEKLAWNEIINKVKEKLTTLKETDKLLKDKLYEVSINFKAKGAEVSEWDIIEQENLKRMMQFAETIVNTVNAPIMNDDDALTQNIRKIQEKSANLVREINVKWG